MRDKEKQKKKQHESWLRHKEEYRIKFRDKRRDFRKWVWDLKKGKKCKECGESRIPTLEFHHREQDDKEFELSKMADNPSELQKERFLEEIKKCDILCSNCHRVLHFDSREDILLE
jgi:hypothetical protein